MEIKTSKTEKDNNKVKMFFDKIFSMLFQAVQDKEKFFIVFFGIILLIVLLSVLENKMAAAATAIITGCFGVFTWYHTQKMERIRQEYHAKEERYTKLISAVKGFYKNQDDLKLKQEFIDQTNLCWLYCPDEVIKKSNLFLDSVKEGVPTTNEQKERALGEFMLSLRQDLFSHQKKTTEFSWSDFKSYSPNKSTQPTQQEGK